MGLRTLLFGNRRFRMHRIIGGRTVIQIVIWSAIAVGVVTVSQSPSLLGGNLSMAVFFSALPVALVPLVVIGVSVIIVLLSVVKEVRYVVFGRRVGSYNNDPHLNDNELEDGGLFDTIGDLGGVDGGFDGGDDE